MLSHDEAELYDRQIRLWGVNAQSRLRQSKVLMLGFNGLASEVAKILVLAGIDTLTIVDDKPLQESDPTSNLFCRPASNQDGEESKFRTHAVKEKLRTLNPLVKVHIDNSPISSKVAKDFEGYDLVTLHSFLTIDETSLINEACRSNSIKFYLVIDFGLFGFMFNDLGINFKFTYEEFNKLSQKEYHREKSIKINSGKIEEAGDDDASDNEVGAGPRKKRRVDPEEVKDKPVISIDEDDERQNKVDSLNYVTFRDMLSLKNTSFSKQTSPILFVSVAMIKFYDTHKRSPRINDLGEPNQDDLIELNKIIESLKSSVDIPSCIFAKLNEDWSSNIGGSLSPVCAILGGIAGQDMIRVLSNKDIPIYNTFSFDGLNMTGLVERVGIEDIKCNAPIVRDFLEIDDDDDDQY